MNQTNHLPDYIANITNFDLKQNKKYIYVPGPQNQS